ncbi:MAG: hypothetical protein FJW79_04555 [Actinobacteria bacterium]|nr:hypothetical protein [Actinomycetota bacterium]
MRKVLGLLLALLLGSMSALGTTARAAEEDARVAGKHLWTRQFGTDTYERGQGVAVNASGVDVVGHTGGTFPGQTSQGGQDGFVRKYDHTGKVMWTRQFGTIGSDDASAVAVDASGVYVVGDTTGALPGQTSRDLSDVFVRKYDHNGKVLWTRQFGTDESDRGRAVAVDASGIYVAGSTQGTLPGQTPQGQTDAFVRKYDRDGRYLWTRQFGTGESDHIRGATVVASGVYVTGYTEGAFPGWENRGGRDVFVRKYDPAGKLRWTRQFGTGAWDEGYGVAANASGVYVTGYVKGPLPNQTHQGGEDVFLRKYDPAGKVLWTRQFGTFTLDEGWGVALNASGVYVTGRTSAALPGQTYLDWWDVFARAYGHNGQQQWTRQFGTVDKDWGSAVAATASALYLAGDTGGTLPGQTSRGGLDAFVRKYATG